MRNKLFIILQYCLPQHVLSRLVGLLADSEEPAQAKINCFIQPTF